VIKAKRSEGVSKKEAIKIILVVSVIKWYLKLEDISKGRPPRGLYYTLY